MSYPETRRRRRSSSLGRGPLGRFWKRIWERIPEGAAATTGFALLVLLGIALMTRSEPRNVYAGVTAVSVGGLGILWQAWLWRLRAQEYRKLKEAAEQKTEVRSARRQRNSDDQEDRKRRSATDTAARKRSKEVQNLVRRAETDKATAEKAYRRGREEAIARDAMRLLTMSEIALLDAASEGFETRGFIVGRDVDDARRDMLLRGEEGDVRIVARLAPLGRKVEVADVDAVETWRGDLGATAGILIGIAGFTPEAVLRASSLPVTLAEAYLLAQWRVGGPLNEAQEADSVE